VQLRRGAGNPLRARQVPPQHVHDRDRVAQRVVVLQPEHAADAVRAHVRIAVAVPADPAAERERALFRVRVQPQPAQLVRELVQHVGHGVGVQVVEVPDRVARLVHHVRPGDPQLVRLPEQVDRLLEPCSHARAGGREQVGDLPELVEHRAARRLGRVGGEHGPHAEPLDLLGKLRARNARRGDPVHRLRQPAPVALPHARELASAVHLLGHVRQVEVRRERAHQPGRCRRLHLSEQRGSLRPIRADQPARALHQLEQLLALLADQRAPKQGAELADVAAEAGVALSRVQSDSCDRRRTRRGRRGRPAPR
jgi:hypothetical protein